MTQAIDFLLGFVWIASALSCFIAVGNAQHKDGGLYEPMWRMPTWLMIGGAGLAVFPFLGTVAAIAMWSYIAEGKRHD